MTLDEELNLSKSLVSLSGKNVAHDTCLVSPDCIHFTNVSYTPWSVLGAAYTREIGCRSWLHGGYHHGEGTDVIQMILQIVVKNHSESRSSESLQEDLTKGVPYQGFGIALGQSSLQIVNNHHKQGSDLASQGSGTCCRSVRQHILF